MMRFLRTTTFITMAIGTSWTSICLFQHLLPASFLPTKRFYLSGLLGGLWAFVDRKKGRGRFLYSTRLSIESAWKVAVKHLYVKPIKYPPFFSSLVSPLPSAVIWRALTGDRGGDVVLFALSLGVLMTIFEKSPASITGGTVRKTMSWISGRGFVDPVPGADEIRGFTRGVSPGATSVTSTDVSTVESTDESPEGGDLVLDSTGWSSLSSDIGEGIRVLEDPLAKSPTAM